MRSVAAAKLRLNSKDSCSRSSKWYQEKDLTAWLHGRRGAAFFDLKTVDAAVRWVDYRPIKPASFQTFLKNSGHWKALSKQSTFHWRNKKQHKWPKLCRDECHCKLWSCRRVFSGQPKESPLAINTKVIFGSITADTIRKKQVFQLKKRANTDSTISGQ